MNAAATLTRELEQRVLTPAVEAVASDGRKQRWEKHKLDRRAELTAGTVEAVRVLGPDAGMDDIARHIGVSKTVLYRYFTDKNDLAAAVTLTYVESTIMPRLIEALSGDIGDYRLVRAVISVYVETVSSDPNVYRFTMARPSGSRPVAAEAEKIFAGALESTLEARLAARGAQTGGARTWARAMVGAITLAVEEWIAVPDRTSHDMAEELTMLVWSGLVGIVGAGGDPERFAADPPKFPPIED
ncbi:TetR family transcriptional regulator [Gordonia neofelifaecis NRRL B-59395]|uniref:TetR family transcriptional regulator n=1 Tax=Gordonia neofelifaecis NRRL B-59395 TaxID=644548 RepID=F1YLK3_9ACTN|nr:TetR family transcriptional regulator [Gordonia neofelifaecis NRRL B-59395]